MPSSPSSPYIRNDAPSPSKDEQRSILFRESSDRCIVCGRRREDIRDWSICRILPIHTGKDVSVEGKAILCSYCVGAKHKMGVAEFAASRPFAQRLAYWFRVQNAARKGLISPYKRNLLLEDFSIFHRGDALKTDIKPSHSFTILSKETCRCCIYCGAPLSVTGVTYDHIIPRSRGGSRGLENITISCETCNAAKGSMSVEDFVATFTESKRKRYIKRVHRLVKDHHLPEEKAKLLLSFENQKAMVFHLNLFRRRYTITLKAEKL